MITILDDFSTKRRLYLSPITEILKAIRKRDGLPVILKIRRGMIGAEHRITLQNEYEIGKTLTFADCPRYLSLEEAEDASILISVDDKMYALGNTIPNDGFSLSKMMDLSISIASAIEKIHRMGIIHKDINPFNIIISSALDSIRLIDFELSVKINEEYKGFSPSSTIKGTLPYISTEQTGRVNKPIDSRSDLYSFGITLFQLATGKLPFNDATPTDLIYAHIAKIPRPISEIRKDIPCVYSEIIGKLLMKSPDERYQTVTGVKDDLILLRNLISEGKQNIHFIPGEKEFKSKIFLPRKLYGRDDEIGVILNSFRKISRKGQVVIIRGEAGTGKTAIVSELYSPITDRHGFFLSGKFDPFSHHYPYTAIADALEDFTLQYLDLGGEKKKMWADAVKSSVGDCGQILIDIAPAFKELIGIPPEVPQLSPNENHRRRNLLFSNLIRDIADMGHPLVLFLDDLQWADSETLSLIESLIEKQPKNFLLILSYRDDEISPFHSSFLPLESSETAHSDIIHIHLKSLSKEAVYDWIHDFLSGSEKASRDLVMLVWARTSGNPFFISTLLQMIIESKHIRRLPDGSLSADVDSISKMPADENIIDHLMRKIENLNSLDRLFLTHASILGRSIPLSTIELLLEPTGNELKKALERLVASHLLIKDNDRILFSHDRIHQAAYALLPGDMRKKLHLKAGEKIRSELIQRGLSDEKIETYINHFNDAMELVTDEKTRSELARLNIKEGKCMKRKTAYRAAEHFFSHALAFLSPNPFEKDYSVAMDLFIEYGETLYFNQKYEEGKKLFETGLSQSKCSLDSSRIYVRQISHYASNHFPEKALNLVIEALRSLGLSFPKKMPFFWTFCEFFRIHRLLRMKKPESILELPTSDSPLLLAQMAVLSAASVSTYVTFPDLFPVFLLKEVSLSLKYGNSDFSSDAYLAFAVLLCIKGYIDEGYACGTAALRLREKMSSSSHFLTKNLFIFGFFVSHWKEPFEKGIHKIESAIENRHKSGDFEYASYAASTIMYMHFYAGKSIYYLLNEYPKQHRILSELGSDYSIHQAKYFHQLLLTMNDPTGDGITVSGDFADEKKLFEMLKEMRVLTSLAIYWIGKMQLAYLSSDVKTALSAAEEALTLMPSLFGTIFIPIFHFFYALSAIAFCRRQIIEKRSSSRLLMSKAKKSLKKLKKWGNSSPENYLAKAQIVEAEFLSLRKIDVKVLRCYESAIENAGKRGNNLDLGIALESMGRILLSIGLKSNAFSYIRRSMMVFHGWGALNKSNSLKKEFDLQMDDIPLIMRESDFFSRSFKAKLELETLVGMIQSLTSNLKFTSLLETLINAMMKNSGATRGIYIHAENGNLEVTAEKKSNGHFHIFKGEKSRLSIFDLDIPLIEKCYFNNQAYVLENVSPGSPLKKRETEKYSLTSVLIIPLKRQSIVIGLVYLENNLMEDAFRKEHIQFLTLISDQAAIAIENSMIFRKLNEEKNYSSSIINNAPSLIFGIDENGTTTFTNPVVEKITGYSKDELIGKNWWKLLYPSTAYVHAEQVLKMIPEKELVDYEMPLITQKGEQRDILWNSFSRKNKKGVLVGMIGFGTDITERKKAEEEKKKIETEYHQVRKMDSIGLLAGGVAHDLNNLLSPILGYAEILLEELPLNDTRLEALNEIVSAGYRARDLVRQLLTFSRKQPLERNPLNLNTVIRGIEKLLRRTIREDILIDLILSPDIENSLADIGQIEQVIMNLSVNAQDAMPKGGILTLRTANVMMEFSASELKPYVMLAVCDNGSGMNEETKERIFEPFFSTKGEFGTGLGLATVYGIVKQHDGRIEVESAPGKGAIFKIYLSPCTEEIKTFTKEEDIRNEKQRGIETILIVEDNEQVLKLTRNILEKSGYTVLISRSGSEAMAILNSYENTIHLLLTDVIMPDMNGKDLFLKTQEKYPDLKVLYMSGYMNNVLNFQEITENRVSFIQKPFTIKTLTSKIRKILHQR